MPWKSAFASAELWGGDVEFVMAHPGISPASSIRRGRKSAATGPATSGTDARGVGQQGEGASRQLVAALVRLAGAAFRQAGRRTEAAEVKLAPRRVL